MRILVTGSRLWSDTRNVASVLGAVDAHVREPVTLVHGAQGGMVHSETGGWHARGLDFIAAQEAERYGWALEPYPADWEGPCRSTCRPGHRRRRGGVWICPAAGPYRNERMAGAGADVCLAWPGGAGTADMVRRARAAGIPVVRVDAGRGFVWPLAFAGLGAARGRGEASALRDPS